MTPEPSQIAYLALFLWLPIVVYIFSRFPVQKAIIFSILGGWLFLPMASMKLPGIPIYDKMAATSYGILLSTIIFDVGRFSLFRLSWIDIPVIVWCICPFFSSMSNGLGAYDGFSAVFAQVVAWGIPYFIGRIYFNSLTGLRDLAIGIFVGGLLYVPLCLFESRMMMSVHELVYGYNPVPFEMAIRLGGYRPSVFMEHGLMLSVWMMSALLMGVVLWRFKILKQLWNYPISWWVGILLLTFVMVRSTGAYMLFAIALGILWVAWRFRNTWAIWLIVAGMCFFLQISSTGQLPRLQVIGAMSQVFPAERVQSVDFRFTNEEILSAKARQRMTFGWGGFGRNRVYDEYGADISITDSLWIIAFGINGLVGLISIFTTLLLPALTFCIRYPARLWSNPSVAPAAALAVGLVMYALDCVLNAMLNPIFTLICGGLAGLVIGQRQLVNLKQRVSVRA